MADTERITPAAPQIAKDRKAEEDRQQAVVDAVHDVTHGKDGKPIPILPPEIGGVKVVGGKT